jgi:hypothetical protein
MNFPNCKNDATIYCLTTLSIVNENKEHFQDVLTSCHKMVTKLYLKTVKCRGMCD